MPRAYQNRQADELAGRRPRRVPPCPRVRLSQARALVWRIHRLIPIWLLCILTPCASLAAAGNPPPGFDQANQLYERGKYREAVAAYEKLIQQGQTSTAVFFNLGNAYFKTGQIGRAIVNYRLAQCLAPQDADVRANLYFARRAVPASNSAARPLWSRLAHALTLDELAILGSVVWWLFFLFLTASEWRRRRLARSAVAASGAAAASVLLWLGLAGYFHATQQAVVISGKAPLHYGPLIESESFFSAPEGSELPVVTRKGSWLEVMDSNRRLGWVQEENVVVLRGG